MRQAQHIKPYVSIGGTRATLDGVLRRSFSTACQPVCPAWTHLRKNLT